MKGSGFMDMETFLVKGSSLSDSNNPLIGYRKDAAGLTSENLVQLWRSVDWYNGSAQTPDWLLMAIQNSSYIITAWDKGKLVGLCSAISDKVLNTWISYMVVDKDYHNKKIGSFMIEELKEYYRGFRIFVQSSKAQEFYKQHGFKEDMHSLTFNHP